MFDKIPTFRGKKTLPRFSKVAEIFSLKPAYPVQPFCKWISQFREGKTGEMDKHKSGSDIAGGS